MSINYKPTANAHNNSISIHSSIYSMLFFVQRKICSTGFLKNKKIPLSFRALKP